MLCSRDNSNLAVSENIAHLIAQTSQQEAVAPPALARSCSIHQNVTWFIEVDLALEICTPRNRRRISQAQGSFARARSLAIQQPTYALVQLRRTSAIAGRTCLQLHNQIWPHGSAFDSAVSAAKECKDRTVAFAAPRFEILVPARMLKASVAWS